MSPESPSNEPTESAIFGPEANALKHGFCAAKIVDPELKARIDEMHRQLVETHEPWSPEEVEAVAELAQALARLERLEIAMDTKVMNEKARSGELYDNNARAAFDAGLARCRDNPALHTPSLGQSWHGANWLRNIWQSVENELAVDAIDSNPANANLNEFVAPFLPFQLACDAALALGGCWQVDRAEGEAAWLMARYVRITPEPETALALWVERSKAPDGPKFSLARARRLLAKAPADPARAAAELAAKATSEKRRWAMQANALRTDYETARDLARTMAVGTGMGDPALEKEFRLLSRYLTTARNRADRIRRRVDILKKDRKTFAWRTQQKAEREVRRLKRESEVARRRVEAELAREERQPRGNADDRSAYPVYAAQSHESRKPESTGFETAPISASDEGVVDASLVSIFDDFKPELRNGIGAEIEPGDMDMIEAVETPGPSFETRVPAEFQVDPNAPGRRQLLQLPREKSSFRQRFPLMRHRNWADPAEVMEDEALILRGFMALPESFERRFTLQSLFETMDEFDRAWQAYAKWADQDLVRRAEAEHRAMSSGEATGR